MPVTFPIVVADDSHFPIENIPFGVFSTSADSTPRIATIVGTHILDLKLVSNAGHFSAIALQPEFPGTSSLADVLAESTLNSFAALGQAVRSQTRTRIIDLLSDGSSALFTNKDLNERAFVPVADATMHLPMKIGGFTDFLTSEIHATNCAEMAGQKLHPSFRHFPTAYNGRASSVVISGTPIVRPHGMVLSQTQNPPSYILSPTQRFDFELEVGIFISRSISYSTSSISTPTAQQSHIFGFVLLNDWSARDIQFAEMLPLGPFNGKGSGTTISPWIVVPEALSHARTAPSSPTVQDSHARLAPHLQHDDLDSSTWDIALEVSLIPHELGSTSTSNDKSTQQQQHQGGNGQHVICRSNLKHGTWSPAQMVAHHASSGCGLAAGDLLGSGTVSGPNHIPIFSPTLGCLHELTAAGTKKIQVSGNIQRMWLEDGDEVVLTAWADAASTAATAAAGRGDGQQTKRKMIGFGEARGVVVSRS